jgi:hypothetical protein
VRDTVVDIIFFFDIGLQFFIAYQEAPEKGGAWVYDNLKIVRRYARSWLVLDVLTAVPVDVILAAYETAGAAGEADASDAAGAESLRIVRMLRLFKLVRILRASRLFQRYEAHLGITYAMLHLVKMANLVVLTTHWLACLWVLVGRIDPADDGSKPQGLRGSRGALWSCSLRRLLEHHFS